MYIMVCLPDFCLGNQNKTTAPFSRDKASSDATPVPISGPNGDVPNDQDGNENQDEADARHTAIVYFCLFSLLLLHMGCVIIACMLCFRHAVSNSSWFGNSNRNNGNSDEGSQNGGTGNNASSAADPYEEYLVSSKSVHKDLFTSLDSPKCSPYRVEFVHHEHQSRQPIRVPFIGYDLPKVVESIGAEDSDKRIALSESQVVVTANRETPVISYSAGIENRSFVDENDRSSGQPNSNEQIVIASTSADAVDDATGAASCSSNMPGIAAPQSALRRSGSALPDTRTLQRLRGTLTIRSKSVSCKIIGRPQFNYVDIFKGRKTKLGEAFICDVSEFPPQMSFNSAWIPRKSLIRLSQFA